MRKPVQNWSRQGSYFWTADAIWVHGYLRFEPGAWKWNEGLPCLSADCKNLSHWFCLNSATVYQIERSYRGMFLGFFKTFLEGSVYYIIYRDYIANRRSSICCTLASRHLAVYSQPYPSNSWSTQEFYSIAASTFSLKTHKSVKRTNLKLGITGCKFSWQSSFSSHEHYKKTNNERKNNLFAAVWDNFFFPAGFLGCVHETDVYVWGAWRTDKLSIIVILPTSRPLHTCLVHTP